MVLAKTVELDVPHDDQVLVGLFEHGVADHIRRAEAGTRVSQASDVATVRCLL
jgi:hypothetical protein